MKRTSNMVTTSNMYTTLNMKTTEKMKTTLQFQDPNVSNYVLSKNIPVALGARQRAEMLVNHKLKA